MRECSSESFASTCLGSAERSPKPKRARPISRFARVRAPAAAAAPAPAPPPLRSPHGTAGCTPTGAIAAAGGGALTRGLNVQCPESSE